MGWYLTIMSRGVVLFTASTHSRQEIEDLAAEARRLRPDVEIVIRPPVGVAYRCSELRAAMTQGAGLEIIPSAILARASR